MSFEHNVYEKGYYTMQGKEYITLVYISQFLWTFELYRNYADGTVFSLIKECFDEIEKLIERWVVDFSIDIDFSAKYFDEREGIYRCEDEIDCNIVSEYLDGWDTKTYWLLDWRQNALERFLKTTVRN